MKALNPKLSSFNIVAITFIIIALFLLFTSCSKEQIKKIENNGISIGKGATVWLILAIVFALLLGAVFGGITKEETRIKEEIKKMKKG